MKLIKNFLDQKTFDYIYDLIQSPGNFNWYYTPNVAFHKDTYGFMFNHTFLNEDGIQSEYFNQIITPIINPLSIRHLVRAKANLYTKQDNNIKHKFHIDDSTLNKYKVGLFSLNTNDGYTEFEDGSIMKSVANQMCIFDGSIKHRSVTQTDTKVRLNINLNFVEYE